MKQEVQYLLEIVKYILNKQQGEAPIPAKDMDWEALIKLAKNHSILNLVHYAVDKLPDEHKPDADRCKHLYQASVNAIVRNYNQIEGIKEIFQKFEEEGIYVFAVKGICTKNHYPQTDMRTMGDIDLLYRPEQNAKVKKAMRELGYDGRVEGRQHDCYSRLPYMSVEMHRDLVEADSEYSSYYETIWERVKPKEGFQYVHELSLEDEFIYTFAHLVRHFQTGGIGIRFIMDVYVYSHLEGMDWRYVEAELKKLGVWEFYKNLSELAEVWFGTELCMGKGDGELINKLASYIISNGTFGTLKNAAAVMVAKNGKHAFLWKTVFPNLKNMQSMFPWLNKWPILLPYAWILRGVRSITTRRKNIHEQLDRYKNGDEEYGKELQRFFETCGLKEKKNKTNIKQDKEINFLLEIIKYILNNEMGQFPILGKDLDWNRLINIARSHNLIYILYYGVEWLPTENRPDKNIYQRLQETAWYDLVVSCNQIEASKMLMEQFEEDGVSIAMVKGICTKQRYPLPELRSMGDIDILYKESQHSEMKKSMSKLQFKRGAEGRKHDHFYCEPYIQVEMHRELLATDSLYYPYYEHIWDRLQLCDGSQYVYKMKLEDEYIYSFVHLVEHFKNGGIGIRFVMDVFAYNNIKNMNWEYIEEELKKLNLWSFYKNISKLADMWFETGEQSSGDNEKIVEGLSDYIVSNGTFGTQVNSASVSVENGKIQFLFKSAFPNLRSMQSMYPWLKKWPFLLPCGWLIRGISGMLFRRKHVEIYYNQYKHGNKERGRQLKTFFETCGL